MLQGHVADLLQSSHASSTIEQAVTCQAMQMAGLKPTAAECAGLAGPTHSTAVGIRQTFQFLQVPSCSALVRQQVQATYVANCQHRPYVDDHAIKNIAKLCLLSDAHMSLQLQEKWDMHVTYVCVFACQSLQKRSKASNARSANKAELASC